MTTSAKLVVGCGYLGLRVARLWRGAGARVLALTRSPDRATALAAEGLEPVLGDVTTPGSLPPLPAVDMIFWAVGFDRASGATYRDVHVTGLGHVLDAVPGTSRVVFSSSTGVWGTDDRAVVTESTPAHPAREAGRVLLEAEALLRARTGDRGTALRFAGLYGPGRLPRLDDLKAGRPIAADPDSWLNLIHADDAAAVVCAVAEAAATRPLYVVSDGHPVRRRDWYGRLAAVTDSPSPTWDLAAPRSRGADKRVDPSLLFRDVSVTLEHPDPLGGLESALRG